MYSALHRNHEFAAKHTCNEIAFVSYCSRYRETRDIFIGNDNRILYLVGKLSKSASQYNTCMRYSSSQLLFDVFCSLINLFCSCIHVLYVLVNNKYVEGVMHLILHDFHQLVLSRGNNLRLILDSAVPHDETST